MVSTRQTLDNQPSGLSKIERRVEVGTNAHQNLTNKASEQGPQPYTLLIVCVLKPHVLLPTFHQLSSFPTQNRGFSSCLRPRFLLGTQRTFSPGSSPRGPQFPPRPSQATPHSPRTWDTAASQLPLQLLPKSAPPSCPAAGADVETHKRRRR